MELRGIVRKVVDGISDIDIYVRNEKKPSIYARIVDGEWTGTFNPNGLYSDAGLSYDEIVRISNFIDVYRSQLIELLEELHIF